MNLYAKILVSRCHLDALTCERGKNPVGHRGLWGIPGELATGEHVFVGRMIDFVCWGSDVVERGVVTAIVPTADAYAELSGKPCSAVNDFWFRWEARSA